MLSLYNLCTIPCTFEAHLVHPGGEETLAGRHPVGGVQHSVVATQHQDQQHSHKLGRAYVQQPEQRGRALNESQIGHQESGIFNSGESLSSWSQMKYWQLG